MHKNKDVLKKNLRDPLTLVEYEIAGLDIAQNKDALLLITLALIIVRHCDVTLRHHIYRTDVPSGSGLFGNREVSIECVQHHTRRFALTQKSNCAKKKQLCLDIHKA